MISSTKTSPSRGKIGVILVNLGTPDKADFKSVKRYLKQFLSDPRVIEVNPIIWKLILNCFILPFRTKKSVKAYKAIWMQDIDESPLYYYTRQQAKKLARKFSKEDVEITWAMRYGNPSIKSVLENLQKRDCHHIVVLPLYPQYSATTTATVNDEVFRCLQGMRWQPTLRIAPPYESHPSYIDALKKSITTHLKTLNWVPHKILVSFHGLPVEYVQKGDPYEDFCKQTTILLKKALSKDSPSLELSFQSRFGPHEWLQPYTDKTLESYAAHGIKKIAVITPGFASDCIETLEEIQIKGREIFIKNGGTNFTQIPCLNDSDDSIDLFEELVRESLSGWVSI